MLNKVVRGCSDEGRHLETSVITFLFTFSRLPNQIKSNDFKAGLNFPFVSRQLCVRYLVLMVVNALHQGRVGALLDTLERAVKKVNIENLF